MYAHRNVYLVYLLFTGKVDYVTDRPDLVDSIVCYPTQEGKNPSYMTNRPGSATRRIEPQYWVYIY